MNNFTPRNSEVESESKSYTYIQSNYVGDIIKMKFLETRVIVYDTMAPFIVPSLLNEYAFEVEYRWGDCSATWVNLYKNWYKITLQHAILFQRYSCDNCVNDEDIVSCELNLELSVNSCNGALIKRTEEK